MGFHEEKWKRRKKLQNAMEHHKLQTEGNGISCRLDCRCTSKNPICMALLLFFCMVFNAAVNGQSEPLKHQPPYHCLRHILGTSLSPKVFLDMHFQKRVSYIPKAALETDSLGPSQPQYPTLDVLPISYVTFLTRTIDLRRSGAVQIMRDGYSLDTERHSISPFLLNYALVESATLTFQNIHFLHSTLYNWARCLQNDLNLPVRLDIWVYPPLAAGMNPHAEYQDIFLVQVEGTIEIAVCEKIALEIPDPQDAESPPLEFSVDHLQSGLCSSYTLHAGSVLHIPLGYIHYATTPDNAVLSVTHAWHITRTGFTFGAILEAMAASKVEFSPLASYFKSLQANSEELMYLIDVEVVSRSVDNDDMPAGWMDKFSDRILSFLRGLHGQADLSSPSVVEIDGVKKHFTLENLLNKLIAMLTSDHSLIATSLRELRLKIASSFLASYPPHLVNIVDWKTEGRNALGGIYPSTLLYRLQDVLVSIDTAQDMVILNLEHFPLPAEDELGGYRFCLGVYDNHTAQGKVFKVSDIPVNSARMQRSIGSLLLNVGAVSKATPSDVSRLGMYIPFKQTTLPVINKSSSTLDTDAYFDISLDSMPESNVNRFESKGTAEL